MKIILIVLAIYLVVAMAAFAAQLLFSVGDSDQSGIPWKLIIKNSIGWLPILFKLIFR